MHPVAKKINLYHILNACAQSFTVLLSISGSSQPAQNAARALELLFRPSLARHFGGADLGYIQSAIQSVMQHVSDDPVSNPAHIENVRIMQRLLRYFNDDGSFNDDRMPEISIPQVRRWVDDVDWHRRVSAALLSPEFGLREDIREKVQDAAISVRMVENGLHGRHNFFIAIRSVPHHLIQTLHNFQGLSEEVDKNAPDQFRPIPQSLGHFSFGTADWSVLRGPIPNSEEIHWMEQAGVIRIVHLGSRSTRQRQLKQEAESFGLEYVNIPIVSFPKSPQKIAELIQKFSAGVTPLHNAFGNPLIYVSSSSDAKYSGKMFAALRVHRGMQAEEAMKCEVLEADVRDQIIAFGDHVAEGGE